MQGWRYFECWECAESWKSECRDHNSPSTEDCPCGESVAPLHSEPDELIKVDKWGNLVVPSKQVYLAS